MPRKMKLLCPVCRSKQEVTKIKDILCPYCICNKCNSTLIMVESETYDQMEKLSIEIVKVDTE